MSFFHDKQFRYALLAFCVFNVLLYGFIFIFHSVIPKNTQAYKKEAYIYQKDLYMTGGSFNLFSSLAQFDAQWYLEIADKGYSTLHTVKNQKALSVNELSYAFFPLFPALLHVSGDLLPISHPEISAFIVTNLLLVLNFISMFYIVASQFSGKIAIRSVFLLFLFPFSIFFRSYFTEGLYLLFLLWFFYFFQKQTYVKAGAFLGLLTVTKLSGFLINVVFLIYLCHKLFKRQISLPIFLIANTLSILPLFLWGMFCFIHTGNFLYFFTIRSY